MKTYKTIDYYGNFLLFVAIVFLAAFKNDVFMVIMFYPIFCIWHVQSMIVHYFTKNKILLHPWRAFLSKLSLALVMFFLILIGGFATSLLKFDNFLPVVLYFFISITPIMAVFYIIICFKELQHYNKRPLSYFK